MASLFCPRKFKGGSKVKESKIYGSWQFKKWVFDWEVKVFTDRFLSPKHLGYIYNLDRFNVISEIIDGYHERHSEQVAQDRFVWTTFAGAFIKEHQMLGLRSDKCYINRCLYVLLIISFYLRLNGSDLVKEILREIITCTGNLRFIFSFLPGISIRLYSSLLWTHPLLYEDKLCRDYFNLIDADSTSLSTQYKDAFKCSQPYLVYVVQHLTPLHMDKNPSSMTLHEALNKAVLPDRKYSLLTLAVHYHDEVLVRLLVDLGASAEIFYWDCLTDSSVSADRIMVASINSIIGSRQFLLAIPDIIEELVEYMDSLVNTISAYAPLIRRSIIQSEQRKSDDIWSRENSIDELDHEIPDIWSSENSIHELNRQIPDIWGMDFEQPFPSLQHICKIRIRHQILVADKCLLPEAIFQLPLPNKMIQYLLLQLD